VKSGGYSGVQLARERYLSVSQALLTRFLFIPYGLATALLRYYCRVLGIVEAVCRRGEKVTPANEAVVHRSTVQ